ncbi:MAG: two-component regulator propeller domain-containing protein [Armatimonadota bacterium]
MIWPTRAKLPSISAPAFSMDEKLRSDELAGVHVCTRRDWPLLDRAGTAWSISEDGAALVRQTGNAVALLTHANSPLAGRQIRDVMQDAQGTLWIASDRGVCLHTPPAGWVHLGADAGMPSIDVRRILLAPNGDRWFATARGLVRLRGGQWSLFRGQRWLPSDDVVDLVAIDEATVAVLCADGSVGGIRAVETTLAAKAEAIEAAIDERHRRHGYVSDCNLTRPGDTSEWTYVASDNDGLWTAIYLAAECFRYACTGESAARDRARESMEALVRLEQVTGIPGFPARAVVHVDEPEVVRSEGEWHPSPCGKWFWKGDTSSDELNGHYFALPVYYELVADEAERALIRDTIRRVTDHLLDNDFRLIDTDGEQTRWAVFTPHLLNETSEWILERGLNSLSMLSFLRVAHAMTGVDRYQQAYESLCRDHQFALNTIDQKIRMPAEVNHSDDELSFLAYYPLFLYERDPDLLAVYRLSMERTMAEERPERNPLWNLIGSLALGRDQGISDAVRTLCEMPTDRIQYDVDNSDRHDVAVSSTSDRGGNAEGIPVLPYSENGMLKWNGNPYQLRRGGGGYAEDDGAAYLLPYWMARYHGLLKEE